MEETTLATILGKNPHINKDDLKKVQDMVQRVRATGGKPAFVAALPPIDPYSTLGKAHTLGSSPLRNKPRK